MPLGLKLYNARVTLSNERLLALDRLLVLKRPFELRAIDAWRQGLLLGFIRPYIGQAVRAVGTCAALAEGDDITCTHRGHGHRIAKRGDMRDRVAERATRAADDCAGKGGNLHRIDVDPGLVGANGIGAGDIRVAVGPGLAFQKRRTPRAQADTAQIPATHVPRGPGMGTRPGTRSRVTQVFFGDGVANAETFHEARNLAGLWRRPVVFCEINLNLNFDGQGLPQHKQASVSQRSGRATGDNRPGIFVDDKDVRVVFEVTCTAVPGARRGHGPEFVEGRTYRGCGLDEGDHEGDPRVYRTHGERAHWQKLDPSRVSSKVLVERGIAASQIEAVEGAAAVSANAIPSARVADALLSGYGEAHNGRVFEWKGRNNYHILAQISRFFAPGFVSHLGCLSPNPSPYPQ